jgi:hypothetical protein
LSEERVTGRWCQAEYANVGTDTIQGRHQMRTEKPRPADNRDAPT